MGRLALPPISAPPATEALVIAAEPLQAPCYIVDDDILVTFTLPGGVLYEQKVKTGETVQELKRKIYAIHGIPFSSLSLYFNGKCMMDPLSLNDIAGVVDQSGVARIEVKVLGPWTVNTQTTTTDEKQNKDNDRDGKDSDKEPSRQVWNETSQNTTKDVLIDKPPTEQSNTQPTVTDIQDANQQGNGKDEKSFHPTSTPFTDFPNDSTSQTAFTSNPTLNMIGDAEPAAPPSPPFPSLPHAALDEGELPPTPRSSKQSACEAATIDMQDDESAFARIETLGGGRRWKLCFLF